MPPFMKNIIANQKMQVKNAVFDMAGAGAPVSGTGIWSLSGMTGLFQTPPTGLGIAGPGSRYIDTNNGTVYFNEGTAAAPYWTPVTLNQKYLLAWGSDFRDGAGEPIADTDATHTIPGSGIRIFGAGIEETDSGFVVAIGEDGPIGTLTASATANKVAAMGVGITTSVPYQPDTHGPLVVEALFTSDSAITARRIFMGFIGTAADALVSPATGSTATITIPQDDMSGMLMDAALTLASTIMLPHNKSDEVPSLLVSALGVNTGSIFPAAGTYSRWRVEINASGVMTAFVNKAQVGQIVASLDVDEETAPVLLVSSEASATKAIAIKNFAAWGYRRSGNF